MGCSWLRPIRAVFHDSASDQLEQNLRRLNLRSDYVVLFNKDDVVLLGYTGEDSSENEQEEWSRKLLQHRLINQVKIKPDWVNSLRGL